jgi:L-threonylcarbamoyladenylate synthase
MSTRLSIDATGAAGARAELERCVAGGGVAVFPADGLYGIACDPLNGKGISRIHRLKGREAGKPSAVLYLSPLALRELLDGQGPRTREAAAALLPGPVTLVVANPDHRYPLACGDDPERLGIRLIEGPLAGAMCPLFQTSANRSGNPAPHRYLDVEPEILDGVELAIDGGELTGEPSTVVDISEVEEGGGWKVLREGGLARSELERALG